MTDKKWPSDKVEKVHIDKLIPYARNSRTHSEEQVSQIAASIKEWGWTTPVLVDEDGGLIAGHGRVMAARKLGIEEVPIMKPVKLVEKAVFDGQQVNGVVLDLFGGSGSKMISCEKNHKQCQMMELDPKYCDVIIKRWCDFTGKDAINEATGEKFPTIKGE